jgi:CubicO group peptidase (beta-lactamase class C family)
MKKKLIPFCVLLTLFTVTLNAQSKWGLPPSPTGNAGSAILDAIDQNDENFRQRFIETQYAESFLNAFPLSMHLQIFQETHDLLGKFEIITAKKSGPHIAELLLQSIGSDKRVRIRYQLEDKEPFRIASIGIEPVSTVPKFRDLPSLEAYLEKQSAAGNFSGALLVAKEDEILLINAFGLASKRYDIKNNVSTRFNIGSINKIFTKVAIYQLYEQDKIDLDKPVGFYLSGLSSDLSEKVTIRHLLEHRSGLGHYWNETYRARFSDLRTVADYIELVKDQPLAFEPGTSQQYSNSGYVVLGAVIEQVSGIDYYEYIRKHIYLRAGMTSSDHFELDRPVENLATGYTNNNPDGSEGKGYERNNNYFALKGSPAGGGYSTVDDLWKFDRALKSGSLFSDPGSEAAKIFSASGGLGIAGGGPGTNAILESDWDSGYTAIVLSNFDPPLAEELGMEIMALLRN